MCSFSNHEELSEQERNMLLTKMYHPLQSQNGMVGEGNVIVARDRFLSRRFRNRDRLLRLRCEWMNAYLHAVLVTVELGSGKGFSPLRLHQNPRLTDAISNVWIERIVEATNREFEDSSVDVMIAPHNIHYFYNRYKCFWEVERVLRPEAVLLIQEFNTSLIVKLLLRIMRHEGWSCKTGAFSATSVVNDPEDPWPANCAVPEMLFANVSRFQDIFTGLEVERNEPCECLIFSIPGGGVATTKVSKLLNANLSLKERIDKALVLLLPSVFVMGRRVVVRKRST